MEPLVSFLCPTRGRPERLKRSVLSVLDVSPRAEMLIRYDSDDNDTHTAVEELIKDCDRVRGFMGLRGRGYTDLNLMYSDLAKEAKACFVWIWNDDALFQPNNGKEWENWLETIAPHRVIIQPAIHQLGTCGYPNDAGSAFPCVPNNLWKDAGHELIQEPADTFMRMISNDLGCRTEFVPGLTIWHDRDRDEVLERHRKH